MNGSRRKRRVARLLIRSSSRPCAGTVDFMPVADLADLEHVLLRDIAAAKDEAGIEIVRISALGKNGSVSALLKTLGTMSPAERRERGRLINGLKERVSEAIAARKEKLRKLALDQRLNTESA